MALSTYSVREASLPSPKHGVANAELAASSVELHQVQTEPIDSIRSPSNLHTKNSRTFSLTYAQKVSKLSANLFPSKKKKRDKKTKVTVHVHE